MVAIARSHMFKVHDDAQVLGFGFVEFATPEPRALGEMFRHLGFVFAGRHSHRPIELYRQGHIVFVVNADPDGGAGAFAQTHGPSVSGYSFYFEDASK